VTAWRRLPEGLISLERTVDAVSVTGEGSPEKPPRQFSTLLPGTCHLNGAETRNYAALAFGRPTFVVALWF
jgi:hypothetical protein